MTGFFSAGLFNTIPDGVVDDFEDNDLAEWSNTGSISIESTNPIEGSYSVQQISRMDGGDNPYSLSGDGLDYYPQKGDKFSALFNVTDTSAETPGIMWGVATNSNGLDGYVVFHYPNNNQLFIQRVDDGAATDLLTPTVTLSINQIYEYEIQWHDGSGSFADDTIELTVYETDGTADLTSELARASEVYNDTVFDSTYPNNNGVGFANGTSPVGKNRVDRYWHLGSVE